MTLKVMKKGIIFLYYYTFVVVSISLGVFIIIMSHFFIFDWSSMSLQRAEYKQYLSQARMVTENYSLVKKYNWKTFEKKAHRSNVLRQETFPTLPVLLLIELSNS